MKKLLTSSKIAAGIWIAFVIITVICVPMLITFTTNDRATSVGFFFDILKDFLPLAPFFLVVLIPIFALQSFLRYKLDMVDLPKLKKHLYIFSALEILVIVLSITVLVPVANSNAALLS